MSGAEILHQKIHERQAKSGYDFTTISQCKIEIRGKIHAIRLKLWLVVRHLIVNGASPWHEFEDYLGYELDEGSASYIRSEINKILHRGGSKFRISMSRIHFSVKQVQKQKR